MDILISQDFYPQIGGAHYWMYQVYKRWPSKVLTLTQDFSTDNKLKKLQKQFDIQKHGSLIIRRKDIYINEINIFSFFFFKKLFCIIKFLRNHKRFNNRITIHCLRAFPEGFAGCLFKKYSTNCKLVTYAHGEEILVSLTSKQLKWISRFVYRHSNLVIANSRATKNLIHNLGSYSKTTIIHPGVDLALFDISPKERRRFRKKWNWHEKTVILITIARLEPRKNQASVLRAMAELRQEGIQLGYIISGTGEQKTKLQELTQSLGLDNWVKFVARIPEREKPLYFAASDIHIMPSIKVGPMIEGFGIVFLEAAAAGIPSVAGNIGGQAEAVRNNETGLIVDGQNLLALKSAIRQLALNKELRKRMGENGKRWAAKHNWGNVTRKTIRAIMEVCKS